MTAIKFLESKRFRLPRVAFITDREQIKEIPYGVPFWYGNPEDEEYIVRIMEYNVLLEKAMSSKLPFNFKRILRDAGFDDMEEFEFCGSTYFNADFSEEGYDELGDLEDWTEFNKDNKSFKKFIKDATAMVDLEKIKELKIIPVWYDNLERAVTTNIMNSATYNPYMYNKKIGMVTGGMELTDNPRNLIIIDISSSIPRGVSVTILTMARQLADRFHADILITGSKSTLYLYENIHTLNIETIYEENGMGNDQTYFKNLVCGDVRHYKTAIVYGDYHTPCNDWSNDYNHNTKQISRADAQKMCRWTVDKVISFHTTSNSDTAGYADFFSPKEVERVSDWVKYLERA